MPAAWAFVEAFPTAQKLTNSGKRAWKKFLHKNKLFRPETYEKRMEIFQNATQLSVREEIARAKSRLALAL